MGPVKPDGHPESQILGEQRREQGNQLPFVLEQHVVGAFLVGCA
jgi:hypothetical protein